MLARLLLLLERDLACLVALAFELLVRDFGLVELLLVEPDGLLQLGVARVARGELGRVRGLERLACLDLLPQLPAQRSQLRLELKRLGATQCFGRRAGPGDGTVVGRAVAKCRSLMRGPRRASAEA